MGIAIYHRYERNDVLLSESQKHIEASLMTAWITGMYQNIVHPNLIQIIHDIRNIMYGFGERKPLRSTGLIEALLSRLDKNFFR